MRRMTYGLVVTMLGLLVPLSSSAQEVTVYAAASLTDAITKISDTYAAQSPNRAIKKSFGASSTLAKQIEQGAPADVFISADVDWVNYLENKKLTRINSKRLLLSNQLVFITALPKSVNPIQFNAQFSLSQTFKGKLCTGDPLSVPVGKYAKQALTFYGWWDDIKPRLVATEDVRTALAFVERGECALGIVYKTDALASNKVRVVGSFPADSHAPIIYPLVLTAQADVDAEEYWNYLQGAEAKRLFAEFGFGSPNP